MINPLLGQFYLPPFSSIRCSDIECAVKVIVCYCYEIVDEVLSREYDHTWETLCYPLLVVENQLRRVWSPIEHLYAVQNTSVLCQVYKKSEAIIVEYKVWMSQHYSLYCAYYNLRNSSYYLTLTRSQKRFVMNTLSQFVFSGCELSVVKRTRYAKIYKQLSSLINIYNDNLLHATNSWKKLILNKERLSGLSDYDLEVIACESKINSDKCGWLLTLEYSVYISVMKYCEDSVLREEMYWAYNTRASDQGPGSEQWDNTFIIHEMLSLRYELAKLLGFNSYSDKVLINRMAKSSCRVISFLQDLSVNICLHANIFFADLKNFVRKYYGCNKLYPWDMLFYIEKQKKYLFCLSEIELRDYFPVNSVLNGIFKIVNCIYGIDIYERYEIDVWHPDVRFFDIIDINGHWLGGFYLDIYSRENKFPGAWVDDFVSMMYDTCGMKQRPIAYLICNFHVMKNKECICLSHDEVSTLFHEFGHVLHHIMTVIDIPGVSGIQGVPLDAVEVPSQFMEKFCWSSQVLQIITSHFSTGESLSISLINQLLKLRKYESSYNLLYQLIYSVFDIRVYSEFRSSQCFDFMEIFNSVKEQLLIFPHMEWERFPHSFSHIFSCDYAAGYYSYLWSDMLASDIWLHFKDNGVLNFQLGQLFLNKVLAPSGSEDFLDLFFSFYGRSPSIECLLQYYYEM